MVIDRIKVLDALLFLLAFCYVFASFPAHATSRGIIVQTQSSSGSTRQMQLYTGYHALVVGCADYHKGWPALPNPVNDAREVASLLDSMGWVVNLLTNPDGTTLRRELNKLVTGPGKNRDKAILVWFSGHGQTIKEADGTKLGYLVPVDAPDPEKDLLGFMEKAISMRQIETVSKQIWSKHVLMAFDSCFSGAIFQMVRTKPSAYIQEKVSYPVRQFITAGREDEQVPDKSVFKDVFIQGIKEGFADLNGDSYVTGEELGAYLQENVINYSRKAQHPQFGKINNPKLDKGDFVFVLKRPEQFSQSSIIQSDLEAENKRLAEEAARLEHERRELEQIREKFETKRRLQEEKKRLEDESQRLEEEKPKLASIPKHVTAPRISLRKEPTIISNEIKIKNMLVEYGFFDRSRNAFGSFENDFADNNDGTVTDRATGLMWQKGGSTSSLENDEAKRYIKRLNKEQFAGHSNWRIPTLEELASLIKKKKRNNLYLSPVFDNKQIRCWTADDTGNSGYYYEFWIVSFKYGEVDQAVFLNRRKYPGWSVSTYNKNTMNYIKAVRSVR